MGAASWLSGGVSRAVSGVRSAMPGQGEREQPPAQATVRSARAAEAAEALTSTAEEPVPGEPAPAPASDPPADPEAAAPSAPATDPAAQAPATKPAARKVAAKKTAKRPAKAAASGSAAHGTAKSGTAARRRGPAARDSAEDQGAGAGAAAVPAAWSDQELVDFRAALDADIARLREELNMGEADLAEMLAHSDPAGDDQADAGAQTLEREQEMSVAANARELLDQSVHALHRLDAGRYGICESCGTRIPAARLRAFPRATLCIGCKQAEERG